MEAIRSHLNVLYGANSTPEAINAANGALLAFQSSQESFQACSLLLADQQCQNGALLHFAASSVLEKLDKSLASTFVQNLLHVVTVRYGQPDWPQLNAALERIVGKLAALRGTAEWSTCVEDILSLSNKGKPSLALGALQQMAEYTQKHFVGLSAAQVVERMQKSSNLVCAAAAQIASPASLYLAEAWVRAGAMPMQTLVPSGLVELAARSLRRNPQGPGLGLLTQVFAAPVMSFRSARSMAHNTLTLDIPEHRELVRIVVQELLSVVKAYESTNNDYDDVAPLVGLVCEMLRSHPSLLDDGRLINFLLFALRQGEPLASHTLPVWIRLEEWMAEESNKGRHIEWTATFSSVLQLLLVSANQEKDEMESTDWRLQLEETVLSCAHVIGAETFFGMISSAPLDVALWAASCASVLHNGRTAFCLPQLFEKALAAPDNVLLEPLATSACVAIHSFRLFLKQHANGMLVRPAARFCGKCLPLSPLPASQALLELCEIAADSLAPEVITLAPFVANALPKVEGETASLLLTACAELLCVLEEKAAAPVVAELLEAILKGAVFGSNALSNVCMRGGVAFCDRSMGECGGVYAAGLRQAWPRLQELMRESEAGCELVSALAIAAAPQCPELLPSVAAELMLVVRNRRSAAAVSGLRAFVTLQSVSDESLARAFIGSIGVCCEVLKECCPEDGELCDAFFDLMRRVLWNPAWLDALCMTPVFGWALTVLENCYACFESNFQCLNAMSRYQTCVFSLYKDSEPRLANVVNAFCPKLIAMHVKACVAGNPLAVRFRAGPLYDALLAVPVQETRFQLFLSGLTDCKLDPKLAARVAHQGVMSAQKSDAMLKAFLSDLSNAARGRDPEFFKSIENGSYE